jgi:hypothetical protein
MQQDVYRWCLCLYRLQISHTSISATNRNVNYARCPAQRRWHRLSEWGGDHIAFFLPINAANKSVVPNSNQMTVYYHTYKTTNHWCSFDAHFNVISNRYLRPLIIVFTTIWPYRYSGCPIETWPCGRAKCSNILTLFTLTQPKFIYLAKTFITLAIHLFINRYSQARPHSLPILYL